MNHIVHTFDSVYDAIDEILNHEYDQGTNERSSCSRDHRGFYQSTGLRDALRIAREGWSEHAADVERLRNEILQSSDIVRLVDEQVRVRRHVVGGGRVDMGRFIGGDPRCMVRRQRRTAETNKRVIRLLVNRGVSGATSGHAIVQQGAYIATLVEVLTVIGFAVEVAVECTSSWGEYTLTHVIGAKAASEALDLHSLLFMVAHPSLQRRLVWALRETESPVIRGAMQLYKGGGYGIPAKVATQAEAWGADLTVSMGSGEAASIDWVRRQVEVVA
jgi:hypothetical protein